MTLPTVGSSYNTYGTELNAHINVSHDSDGKIKNGAEQTTSAAPTTDAMIANKKYVDDQITAAVPDDDAFGALASKSKDTVYLAASDGFVCSTSTTNDQRPNYDVLTDSSNPPTTSRFRARNLDGNSVIGCCVPVKKGDYWKLSDSGTFGNITIYWIPVGG